MARPESGTKERIQEVARELFGEKGVQRTSLQDIAGRLGITKPALYYHFESREELVRSIVQPAIDEGERFVADLELRSETNPPAPRELLEGFFDYNFRHRADLLLVVSDLSTFVDLGLIDSMLAWRERLVRLLFGDRPTLAQSARGVIALGGLQDCCVQFPDPTYEELRDATVTGALAALGL